MGLPLSLQSWHSTHELFDRSSLRRCAGHLARMPQTRLNTCVQLPVNGPASVSPVIAFHMRIVRSFEPETMRWPPRENATDLTESVCPVNGPASISPVVAFHTRIVRS